MSCVSCQKTRVVGSVWPSLSAAGAIVPRGYGVQRECAPSRKSAECRHADPEFLFLAGPAGGAVAEINPAKALCVSCPIQQPSLMCVLIAGQQFRIWGGHTGTSGGDPGRPPRQSHAQVLILNPGPGLHEG